MTARHIQLLLAFIFIGLGGWCILAPHTVEALALKPEYQHLSATSGLLMACFGAQAVLAGTVIAFSEFRPRTFLIFGLVGSLPFLYLIGISSLSPKCSPRSCGWISRVTLRSWAVVSQVTDSNRENWQTLE